MQVLLVAHGVLAELDLREDRAEIVRARLVALLDQIDLQSLHAAFLLPPLAWMYRETGELAQAEEVAAQAAEQARTYNDRLNLVEVLRVQALIHSAQKQWAEAERSLAEALALATAMRCPWAEARLLHAYGDLHARQGQPDSAHERWAAALAIFQHLGARKEIERIEQDIRNLS